jgi:hypothetical protein
MNETDSCLCLVDHTFAEIAKDLGNPPLVFFDLRPANYPMVLVTSHEVAEQISRASPSHPWSVPKSPTIGALVRLIGAESILLRQVGVSISCLVRCCQLILTATGRAMIGSSFENGLTPGLHPSI